MTIAANDNPLPTSLDRAVIGQAMTIRQAHRKFGKSYAAFAGHAGEGKHVLVRKLITSMFRARWTKPMRVARADVMAMHSCMADAA